MFTSSSPPSAGTQLTRIGRALVASKNTAFLRTIAVQATTPTRAGGGGSCCLGIQTHLLRHFEHAASIWIIFKDLLFSKQSFFPILISDWPGRGLVRGCSLDRLISVRCSLSPYSNTISIVPMWGWMLSKCPILDLVLSNMFMMFVLAGQAAKYMYIYADQATVECRTSHRPSASPSQSQLQSKQESSLKLGI